MAEGALAVQAAFELIHDAVNERLVQETVSGAQDAARPREEALLGHAHGDR